MKTISSLDLKECLNNYDRFLPFAKFYVIMFPTRIQKRWRTIKTASSLPTGT